MSDAEKWLTTGPFHVPDQNPNGLENNRLVLTITNPTCSKLRAYVKVYSYTVMSTGYTSSPFQYESSPFVLVEGWLTVHPETSQHLESQLLASNRQYLRIVAGGDFKTENSRTAPGGLEITSAAGHGNELADTVAEEVFPGLDSADPAAFFRFSDYTVCEHRG